jgi:8-amino-7-oxononanoate synthase
MAVIYPVAAFPGRTFVSNGKEYYYFGGTAYLGLQVHKEFQDIYLGNIRIYGTGYSASRASNVRFHIYEKAENKMALRFGCEACFTLSSGYLASQLVAVYFARLGYSLFYASNTHVALHTGNFQNAANLAELQENITNYLQKKAEKPAVILLDTVDFFGRNYPDFEWLKALPMDRIIIVADDSHGFGITGELGNGSYRQLAALKPKELIVCGSLGKGFGIQAGAVLGTRKRIQVIKASSMFAASSPAVPAAMATYLEASSIYVGQLQKLRNNIDSFTTLLKDRGRYFYMPYHPAFTFKDDGLTSFLEDSSIVITNFPYPNDSAEKINRIVLSAQHTAKDIEYLCKTINSFS